MKVTAVIPARLASTRFPEKVLADLGGISILERVWQQVNKMRHTVQILVATDAQKVREHAEAFGATVVMTSPECPNGTARIASMLEEIEGDFVLNVQGDEPFIDPELLDSLIEAAEGSSCDVVTAVYKLTAPAQLSNPNTVKAVRSDNGRAIYFSRSPVPFMRDQAQSEWLAHNDYWGHVGVYGYTRELLSVYDQLQPCNLEEVEKLEQLRFLENGYVIQTVECAGGTIGIDTPEDLATAMNLLNEQEG